MKYTSHMSTYYTVCCAVFALFCIRNFIKWRGNVCGIRNEGGSYWIADNWSYHTQVNCRLLLLLIFVFFCMLLSDLYTLVRNFSAYTRDSLDWRRKNQVWMWKRANFLLYYSKWRIYFCQSYIAIIYYVQSVTQK